MARVFIDSSIIGEEWFSEVLPELLGNKRVRFAYTDHPLLKSETEKARKLGQLYKLAGDMGRRDDVSADASEHHIQLLVGKEQWANEQACDDPHIFAIVYEKPTRFVFSNDGRLAKCRDCLNTIVASRYCKFRLVRTRENYLEKKASIHA